MKKKIIVILLIVLVCLGILIFVNHNKKTDSKEQLNTSEYKLTTKIEEYTTKNQEGTIISKNEVTKVSISNNSKKEQASKIEKTINDKINNYWDRVKETADELIESGFYDATIENLDFGISIKASEYAKSKNNYIIEVTEEGAFNGAKWDAKLLYNFNPNTGELLKLKDISNNYEELEKAIINKVREYLNKEYQKDELFIEDKSDNELFNIIEEDGNWAITEEGLIIIYQKDEIAPSSTGIIEINIDINDIKEYLNSEYK